MENKAKYRIASNCGPPYFFNQEICHDMSKIYIENNMFDQWDTEHVIPQCYLMFSCSIIALTLFLSKILS